MELIVPTYNRSAKVHRALEYYSCIREHINCEIVVLDGSTEEHSVWNERNARLSNNILYIKYDSNSSFHDRMLAYQKSCPEDELIILGNDEDVFLPSYIEKVKAFLSDNPDYSSYIGRYITLARPILGLNRISHYRDFVTVNDLSMEEPRRRLSTFMYMILVGCSPVFFRLDAIAS